MTAPGQKRLQPEGAALTGGFAPEAVGPEHTRGARLNAQLH